jgi:hypothetical protein
MGKKKQSNISFFGRGLLYTFNKMSLGCRAHTCRKTKNLSDEYNRQHVHTQAAAAAERENKNGPE